MRVLANYWLIIIVGLHKKLQICRTKFLLTPVDIVISAGEKEEDKASVALYLKREAVGREEPDCSKCC